MAKTKSIVDQFSSLKAAWSDETSLATKLAAIGELYQTFYPHPVYFGPFSLHTNQIQAALLLKLKSATNEEAYLSLIAILYSLPSDGLLSSFLVDCISHHKLLPTHVSSEKAADAQQTYFDVICTQKFHLPFDLSFNASFAKTLYDIHEQQPTAQIALPAVKDEAAKSLADQLADVGRAYLAKYPRSTSTLFFFNRHTHQTQARLLMTLSGQDDAHAIARAAELLAGLSHGELSQSMMEALDSKYREPILAAFENIKKHGSFEHQFADALLCMK